MMVWASSTKIMYTTHQNTPQLLLLLCNRFYSLTRSVLSQPCPGCIRYEHKRKQRINHSTPKINTIYMCMSTNIATQSHYTISFQSHYTILLYLEPANTVEPSNIIGHAGDSINSAVYTILYIVLRAGQYSGTFKYYRTCWGQYKFSC